MNNAKLVELYVWRADRGLKQRIVMSKYIEGTTAVSYQVPTHRSENIYKPNTSSDLKVILAVVVQQTLTHNSVTRYLRAVPYPTTFTMHLSPWVIRGSAHPHILPRRL